MCLLIMIFVWRWLSSALFARPRPRPRARPRPRVEVAGAFLPRATPFAAGTAFFLGAAGTFFSQL